MLQDLLRSYAELRVPEGTVLRFVIVENDSQPNLSSVVDNFRGQIAPWMVHYHLEPRLGIAHARNHVLDCALRCGDDFLTFADDDEIVARDWLVGLLAARDAADLDIVGSPVRLAPPGADTSRWGRFVWSGLNRQNLRNESKSLRRQSNGNGHKIAIYTGSWMGKLEYFRRTGLRFDVSLALTGGEDGALWAEAKKRGAKTGWTPHAVVHETLAADRLSLCYRYRRSRDSAMQRYGAMLEARKCATLLRLPVLVAGKALSLLLRLLTFPLSGAQALVRAASYLGFIVGVLCACCGMRSEHYRRISGS